MEEQNYEIVSEEEANPPKKKKGKTSRMRNLVQYRDLSDDAFDTIMKEKSESLETSKDFELRIAKKMAEFERDYDLSDMKINDMDTLRALIQAQLTLEDYEQYLFKARAEGITENFVFLAEKIQKAMSDIRADISKAQTDLNITRKVRKSDRDASVLAYITDLKEKAKKFYEAKMSYIFCPKCNMLLATLWTQYPENERNKISLVCGRVMSDGTTCGEKIIISTDELLKSRGTNSREITPESML